MSRKGFEIFIAIAALIMVFIYVWGFSNINKTIKGVTNSPPEIKQIDRDTYEWEAKFCFRGIYLTYEQDLRVFQKNHPDLRVVEAKVTEYKQGYPWRAIIKTTPRNKPLNDSERRINKEVGG